ncbi:aquaporin, partial [Martelella mediterranea]|uniref:aquaporin n=1 Tax=Martelella mediterranea TaxID=293089 RepID=UPI001E2A0EAC
ALTIGRFQQTILGSTAAAAPAGFAGLAIGLTLVAIHLVGIQVTGVSVNPARSFGPALLAGGHALAQLWLFIAAPLAGGVIGALLYRFKALED